MMTFTVPFLISRLMPSRALMVFFLPLKCFSTFFADISTLPSLVVTVSQPPLQLSYQHAEEHNHDQINQSHGDERHKS